MSVSVSLNVGFRRVRSVRVSDSDAPEGVDDARLAWSIRRRDADVSLAAAELYRLRADRVSPRQEPETSSTPAPDLRFIHTAGAPRVALRTGPLFSARCNIYISRLCYDVSVRLSVCLSVKEVHWRIIANLGFKFRSQFTAHCGRGACGREL